MSVVSVGGDISNAVLSLMLADGMAKGGSYIKVKVGYIDWQDILSRYDDTRLSASAVEKVNEVVKRVFEYGGYDFVFDAETLAYMREVHNLSGDVIYDLTDKVVEMLLSMEMENEQ